MKYLKKYLNLGDYKPKIMDSVSLVKGVDQLDVGDVYIDSMNYPGLIAAWSAEGKTNDDPDRDVLKDLTGNGHDITLKGFSFSEMSGYGGYTTNFAKWKKVVEVVIIL